MQHAPVDYELIETMRVKLTETFTEIAALRQKLVMSEEIINQWKRAALDAESRAIAAESRTIAAETKAMKAESKIMEINLQSKKGILYWQTLAEQANLRAGLAERKLNAFLQSESGKKASAPSWTWGSGKSIEEKVVSALKNAKTPLAKIKIMASMVGVNSTQKGTTYRAIWRAVLMIVHQDKRPCGLSMEKEALYDCICKEVNALKTKS
jgi:hypothetical protein